MYRLIHAVYACDIIFVAADTAAAVVIEWWWCCFVILLFQCVFVCVLRRISLLIIYCNTFSESSMLYCRHLFPLPVAFAMVKPSDLLFGTYFSNSIDSFYQFLILRKSTQQRHILHCSVVMALPCRRVIHIPWLFLISNFGIIDSIAMSRQSILVCLLYKTKNNGSEYCMCCVHACIPVVGKMAEKW